MTTNKQIISNERMLNLKEIKNNIIVTEIPNISEFDLESSLGVIFKSNNNVDFYTYEYSRDNQTIYLYSDKVVDLTDYNKFKTNKPCAKTSEILKEIRDVLSKTKTNDLDSISLYSIFKVINKKRTDYEKSKRSFINSIERILKYRCGRNFKVRICDFDYANNLLNLTLDSNENSKWCISERMIFSKVNGKIVLCSEKTENSDIVLFLLGNHLSKLYDHFMVYKEFLLQNGLNIPTNSKFVINITKNGINVNTTTLKNRFKNDFGLSLATLNGEYKCECNSTDILKLLNGKGKEIFEKIFVKIENCPKYLQKDLYELRKEELIKKSLLFSLKEKSLRLTHQIMSAQTK